VLLLLGPYQLLSSLVLELIAPGLATGTAIDPGSIVEPADLAELGQALAGPGILLSVLGLVVNVLAGGAVVALVLQRDRGQRPDLGAAIRTSLGRSGGTIGGSVLVLLASMIAGLAVLVAIALLVIVAPPLGLVLLFVIGVFAVGIGAGLTSLVVVIGIVEERGAWTTFTRALWVLRTRFWRLIGISLLVLLLLGIASLVISLPLGLLALVAGPLAWVVDGVSATLLSVLTVPVGVFAALLVHLDARIRAEGYDLTLRADRLGPGAG
jgi:hypothetical protein